MNILIISVPHDAHALVVACALKRLDHDVTLYSPPSEIGKSKISLKISDNQAAWIGNGGVIQADHFDVIWQRRRSVPTLKKNVHAEDIDFVLRENVKFFLDFWELAHDKTRWIHDSPALRSGESKIRQLARARKCGLRVPDTLISADVDSILNFIRITANDGSQVIYKAFTPVGWENRVKHTAIVDTNTILNNNIVSLTPGIYQRRLDKQFEVRANFFGPHELSVRIDACLTNAGSLDWRSVFDLKNHLSPFQLPDSVRNSCQILLDELGLQMACIDLVVDSDDNFHFIELNQQGQFLWIEEQCPQFRLLDTFLDFLVPNSDTNREQRLAIGFHDIIKSSQYIDLDQRFESGIILEV